MNVKSSLLNWTARNRDVTDGGGLENGFVFFDFFISFATTTLLTVITTANKTTAKAWEQRNIIFKSDLR
jgi:hypothetical protein